MCELTCEAAGISAKDSELRFWLRNYLAARRLSWAMLDFVTDPMERSRYLIQIRTRGNQARAIIQEMRGMH